MQSFDGKLVCFARAPPEACGCGRPVFKAPLLRRTLAQVTAELAWGGNQDQLTEAIISWDPREPNRFWDPSSVPWHSRSGPPTHQPQLTLVSGILFKQRLSYQFLFVTRRKVDLFFPSLVFIHWSGFFKRCSARLGCDDQPDKVSRSTDSKVTRCKTNCNSLWL